MQGSCFASWWEKMTSSAKQSHLGVSLSARVTRWWKEQSPARRRTHLMHGVLGGACFSVLMVGMPFLSSLNIEQQDAQQFRERNLQLAQAQDAGAVLRADAKASPLLRHDWLRSVEYSLERDPASALSRYAALERDRAALSGLKTFEIGAVSRADDVAAQTQCLAEAVYYEARSERTTGQLAVAEVIMNRVRDHRYPNSICGVVYQGATRTTGCQFTFTCDGALDKQPRGVRWQAAQTVAAHVIMGLNELKTGGATHYHATYVNPVWNSGLVRTRQIDTHIFYRFPRGGEWASATARQNRRLEQRRAGLSAIMPAVLEPAATQAELIKTAMPVVAQSRLIEAPVAEPETVAVEAAIPAPRILAEDELAALTAPEVEVPVVSTPAPQIGTEAPVVTRRIVRRIVDGVVVEEREIPVASTGTTANTAS